MSDATDHHSGLQAAVQTALSQNPARVQSLDFGQHRFWIKRVETLRLRMRLLKGDPKAGFERERDALKFLAAKSIPVPDIVAEDDDFLALADAGPTVLMILNDPKTSQHKREEALVAAATALAMLHSKDIAHGRPAIRDLSYLDGKITFLDFENFDPAPATQRRKFRDLLIFTHSLYHWAKEERDEIDICLNAYRNAQPDIWQAAIIWCRANRWINVLTRPLQNLKKRGKDFRPVPFLFNRFR